MKKIAILGSTGSIGTQTLDVISKYPDTFKVVSLVANNNRELLHRQCQEFSPLYADLSVDNPNALSNAVGYDIDMVVVATTGIVALPIVLDCIDRGIDIALANKETLVTAGELITKKLKNSKSKIIPIDSEHSAIFQCLLSSDSEVNRLILTASGGAFWRKNKCELSSVRYVDALKHPNWTMGEKITIDSATMFNKTLEVIEAKWLFGVETDRIDILVQPQSMVHSLVEFCDVTLGQVSPPDMRNAIDFALNYPTAPRDIRPIDINSGEFEFHKVDLHRFPCGGFAYDDLLKIPLMSTIMNGANDVCVEAFKQGKICFEDFWNTIRSVCSSFVGEITGKEVTLANITLYDSLAKQKTIQLIGDL